MNILEKGYNMIRPGARCPYKTKKSDTPDDMLASLRKALAKEGTPLTPDEDEKLTAVIYALSGGGILFEDLTLLLAKAVDHYYVDYSEEKERASSALAFFKKNIFAPPAKLAEITGLTDYEMRSAKLAMRLADDFEYADREERMQKSFELWIKTRRALSMLKTLCRNEMTLACACFPKENVPVSLVLASAARIQAAERFQRACEMILNQDSDRGYLSDAAKAVLAGQGGALLADFRQMLRYTENTRPGAIEDAAHIEELTGA